MRKEFYVVIRDFYTNNIINEFEIVEIYNNMRELENKCKKISKKVKIQGNKITMYI